MNKKVCSILFLLVFFFSNTLFAIGGYVGGGLGASDVSSGGPVLNNNASRDSLALGMRVGMVFDKTFTLGLNINTWSQEEPALFGTVTTSVYPIAIEGNWHIMTDNNGPYVGASVATVLESVSYSIGSLSGTSTSESEPAIGAQGGWNFGLGKSHSVGVEIRYYKIDGDTKYDFTSALVMYSFWFGGRG